MRDYSGPLKERTVKKQQRPGSFPLSPQGALEPAIPSEFKGDKKTRKVRKVRGAFSLVSGALTFVTVILLGFAWFMYTGKSSFEKAGPLREKTVFSVAEGSSLTAIAAKLEREGFITDKRIFIAGTVYHKMQNKLKAGEFAIESGASMRQIMDTIVGGRAVLHKVSIPEGFSSFQIVERLRKHPMLQGEINEIPPEGSLLPDTYKFSGNTSRQEILERMRDAMGRFIAREWLQRAPGLPLKTANEAVILASIVEKETGIADESSRVAAVFINRLRRKMRLQSDPTIIYGLLRGRGKLVDKSGNPRGILRSEKQLKTGYNTYQIDGLPPTPISNPGKASILAVLHPEKTSDLYFVADGTGGHAFAASFTQHKKNVAKWRKIEKQIRARQKSSRVTGSIGQARKPQAGSETAKPGPVENSLDLFSVDSVQLSPGIPLSRIAPEKDIITYPAIGIPVRKPATGVVAQ
jgi:UPF0755 protein